MKFYNLTLKDYIDWGNLLGAAGVCLQAGAPIIGQLLAGGGEGSDADLGVTVFRCKNLDSKYMNKCISKCIHR